MTPAAQSPISSEALQLALRHKIYLGTSSWKYEGWQGMIYHDHYPSKKSFQARCLREYARYFPAVGVDSTFYRFPPPKMIAGLADLTPPDFKFGLKATEEITVYKYPTHPRYGRRGGQLNPQFLNGQLFVEKFLEPVSALGSKLGPIIFQFPVLPKELVDDGSFLGQLDEFLGRLPPGYQYATEIRNRQLFGPPYFTLLRRHGVAHVYSSWSWMPPLGEQLQAPDSRTAEFFVMRLLTPPQVVYGDAVEAFFPYTHIQKPQLEMRDSLVQYLNSAVQSEFPGYVFINNRLEGAAPLTIAQLLERVLAS